jgi:hypothetical protein
MNPFQLSPHQKFLQHGCVGDLNASRATNWTVLPKNLVLQRHQVKKAKSLITGTIEEDKFSALKGCMTSGLWREVVMLHGHRMCTVLLCKVNAYSFHLITVTYSSMYTNSKTRKSMGPTLKSFEILKCVISFETFPITHDQLICTIPTVKIYFLTNNTN